MTVFKTSLPRSEAYWGITKKSDIIDKHYLIINMLLYKTIYCFVKFMFYRINYFKNKY